MNFVTLVKRITRILLTVTLCMLLSLTTKAIAQPPPPCTEPECDINVTDLVTPFDDLYIPFGSVTQGNSSDQTVTVTNDGTTTDLVIGNIGQANPLAAPFSKETDNCSSETISPLASCPLTVRFSPTTPNSFCDSFDIPSNDPDENPVTVTVSGNGFLSGANNPPSTPLLVYPADNQTGLGTTVEFRWKKSTDPDGDSVTYDLTVCEDENLTIDCITELDITASLENKGIYYADIGGAWLLLFGIVLTGSIRGRVKQRRNGETGRQKWSKRRRIGFLIAITMITTVLLVSCGGSGGGGGGGNSSTSDEVSQLVTGLDPSTIYYWKVVAKDGGKETESCVVWSFTTAP